MSKYTTSANRWQFSAGGIDENDIEDGIVNLDKAIIKEIKEELGISQFEIEKVEKKIMKLGGTTRSIAVIYKANISRTANAIKEDFEKYKMNLESLGDQSEFSNLDFIKCDILEMEKFMNKKIYTVDYVISVLNYILNNKLWKKYTLETLNMKLSLWIVMVKHLIMKILIIRVLLEKLK
jgi:hypothetical protein